MDYKNGKIYMLEPTCEYDEGDVYYGHTTSTLVKRLSQHKAPSNTCKSKYLIGKYGRDNIKIVLLEECPCDNKSQLKAVEAKYQRANKCINKQVAGRTDKEYYLDKRDTILEHSHEYQKVNCDTISEQKKEYYQKNCEKINKQRKDHYDINREKILEYKRANSEKINARRRERYAEKKKETLP